MVAALGQPEAGADDTVAVCTAAWPRAERCWHWSDDRPLRHRFGAITNFGSTVTISTREGTLQRALAEVAVESWRFLHAFERALLGVDADQRRRAVSKAHYFQTRLTQALDLASLKLVVLDGSAFGPQLPAHALNVGDFGPDDLLEIAQTLEPVVMGPDGVIRSGSVLVRRVEQ